MNFKSKITALLAGLFLTALSFGQTGKPTEYMGVPGPVTFDKTLYYLTWSSHPSDNYYKQEYLAKGESVDKFKKLILLEMLTGDTKLKDIVGAKVAELKRMKAANPVVNYEAFEKNGEVMLDFLVSANTPDGKSLSIVERNVYRYKSIVHVNGQKAVLLFAVSERAYGNDIDKFLLNLKAHRTDLINLVAAYNIPKAGIAK